MRADAFGQCAADRGRQHGWVARAQRPARQRRRGRQCDGQTIDCAGHQRIAHLQVDAGYGQRGNLKH
jgi:hypothetical protein